MLILIKAARRRVAALGMSPAQEIYFRLVLKNCANVAKGILPATLS